MHGRSGWRMCGGLDAGGACKRAGAISVSGGEIEQFAHFEHVTSSEPSFARFLAEYFCGETGECCPMWSKLHVAGFLAWSMLM